MPDRHLTRGFTLLEMLVVLILVVVLLLIVLPSYQRQMLDTRRSAATTELLELMARQDHFFQDNKRYADSLTDLGLPSHPYAIDANGRNLVVHESSRIYLIDSRLQDNGYTLTAYPERAQAADTVCAALSLTSAGLRTVSGSGSLADCW